MRFVPIKELQEGMAVGESIYNSENRLLIGHHVILNKKMILDLASHGYTGIYIDDEFTRGIEIQQVLKPALRRKTLGVVHNMFQKTMEGSAGYSEEEAIKNLVVDVVDDIMNDGDIMQNMLEVKDYDNYTYNHSVSVGILSVIIGANMGLKYEELQDLLTGALLHDIGKTFINAEVLNNPRRLTEEEWEDMKAHPTYGFEYLNSNFRFHSAVNCAVLEHHENFDGTGYPMGIQGDDIQLYARIIRVADVYDAMASKRPYHEAMLPGDVIEYMMSHVGTQLDPKIVRVMLDNLCVYPVGCEVLLSDGDHAIVTENHRGFILRPTVKRFSTGEIMNMTDDHDALNVTIVELLA